MRARWVCLAVVLFALSGSLPASAYDAHGRPWPGGVIRYYNAAPDQAWAVKRAADAWNASGARVRLVAASAAQADVRIEHFPGVDCTINAEATIGYAANARIWIFKRDDGAPFCNPYMAARLLAHEFGHVLGLEHETRGCSLMNPTTMLQGSELCPKAKLWQWRCKLLTRDDIAGAVALYGGAAHGQPGPSDCDLYAAIQAPTRLTVAPTNVPHQFTVRFRRPPSVTVPAFLSVQHKDPEAFVAGAASGACALNAHRFARRNWSAAVGGTQETALTLRSGTSCVSVWAVDSFGRPSAKPATMTLRVVEG
jgi:Matrixin